MTQRTVPCVIFCGILCAPGYREVLLIMRHCCYALCLAALLFGSGSLIYADEISADVIYSDEDLPAVTVSDVAYAAIEADNDELLQAYMDHALAAEEEPAEAGRHGLRGRDLDVYNILRDHVRDAADGRVFHTEFELDLEELGLADVRYTAEDLGVEAIVVEDETTGNLMISQDAMDNAYERAELNIARIINALTADCPYELYWFDKTKGVDYSGPGISADYDYEIDEYVLVFQSGMTFGFTVEEEYALVVHSDDPDEGDTLAIYDIDPDVTGAIASAVETAGSIVERHADDGDYDRLCGYRQEICGLVSYNYDALEEGTPFGNPWQMIWVFDGNPDTNVVCEGYSKAFQYLCDCSVFDSPLVQSRLVSGWMTGGTGAGDHMWNVVTMDNGLNYVVDVTNCDEGTIGADDQLFLQAPVEGNADEYYVLTCESGRILYEYDEETIDLYEAEELTLTFDEYVPRFVFRADFVIPAGTIRIGEEAFDGLAMKAVKCPEGLEQIDSRAFADCPNLERVFIPETAVTIADDAFDGCAGLTIYGAAGSRAEELAAEQGFAFAEYEE